MRKFTIDQEVNLNPNVHNAFVVSIDVSFGDDDASETIHLGPFPYNLVGESYMDDLLDVLDQMKVLNYNEFAKHGYKVIDCFNNWFGDREDRRNALINEEYLDFTELHKNGEWPWDPIYEMEGQFSAYTINFYDVANTRHAVTVEP